MQEDEDTIQEGDEGAAIATTFDLSHFFHLIDSGGQDQLIDILEKADIFGFCHADQSRRIVNI